jgi:glycolate oxidase FAD binding subunit
VSFAPNAYKPKSTDELAAFVTESYAKGGAIYPLGGGTSLSYGLAAKQPGEQLSLANLNRILDYPARDLTVTVEAGITMQQLSEALAKENQELPIDVPQADRATVGGVVATNWNGPRRLGCGGVRDHVIGITAVDGRGTSFSGGGRVVKNVAGYDFCKLLTGSLGTLAVITELTFKLRPKAERRAILVGELVDLEQAETVLTAFTTSAVRPAAVELITGPAWADVAPLAVAVVLEGTNPEVNWMTDRLGAEWKKAGLPKVSDSAAGDDLWSKLVEFSTGESPLAIKASVLPSGIVPLVAALRKLDPAASIQAHAANGILIAGFSQIPAEGAAKVVLSTLQPLAARFQGHVHVLSSGPGAELTRQCVWGSQDAASEVMAAVKRQFDPKNILNPGRFIFA